MLDKDLHVLVTKTEAERLRKEAFKKKVSISDVIRTGIKLYFEKEKQSKSEFTVTNKNVSAVLAAARRKLRSK